MSLSELKESEKIINDLIDKIKSKNEDIKPIRDGVLDFEKYIAAKYKILWILKEPYEDFEDDGSPSGGGWHFRDAIIPKKKIEDFESGRQTFKPIIYASWGILNKFECYNGMNDIEEDPSMLDALKSVAYINVKKLPGLTRTPYNVLFDAYNITKTILLKQIELYNPEIVIGGHTLHLFYNDLGIQHPIENYKSLKYVVKENRLFIDAYHPAQTQVARDKYVDDIVSIVKKWATQNNKL